MDRLTQFVAVAHLKLRLEILQRNPSLLDEYLEMAPVTPKLPAPMEFAGLKSRLQRAKGLETRSGVVGPQFDAALDVIETGVTMLETHVPELQKYGKDLMDTVNGMLAPSNGGPELDAVAPVATVVEATPAVPTAAGAVAAPALGPNGGPRILNSPTGA